MMLLGPLSFMLFLTSVHWHLEHRIADQGAFLFGVVVLVVIALPERLRLRHARHRSLLRAVFRVSEEAVLRDLANAEEQDRHRVERQITAIMMPPGEP